MNNKALCIHTGLFSHDACKTLMYLFNSDELYDVCNNRNELLSYTIVVEDSTGEAVIVPFWNIDDEDIKRAMEHDDFKSYDEFVKFIGEKIKDVVDYATTTERTVSVDSVDNGRNYDDFHNKDDTEIRLNKKTVLFLGDWFCNKNDKRIRKSYGKKFVEKMIGVQRNVIDVQMLDSLKDEIKLEDEKYLSEIKKLDAWYGEETKKLEKELNDRKISLQEQRDANINLLVTLREDIISGHNNRCLAV